MSGWIWRYKCKHWPWSSSAVYSQCSAGEVTLWMYSCMLLTISVALIVFRVFEYDNKIHVIKPNYINICDSFKYFWNNLNVNSHHLCKECIKFNYPVKSFKLYRNNYRYVLSLHPTLVKLFVCWCNCHFFCRY